MNELRRRQLYDALASRILIIDGAMGTMLHAYHPTVEDYGGAGLENCSEILNRTHPEWITDIHRAYLEAGADIIETNSFQGSPVALAEFGLEPATQELNVTAARLARKAADEFSTTSKPRFVAGSLGPTTKSITLTGDRSRSISFADSYYAHAKALIEGGADILLIETAFDTRNIKAAVLAVHDLEREVGVKIPLMISGTIERCGNDARRATRRRVLRIRRARRSALDRVELRHRPRSDDGSHPHAGADVVDADFVLSERRLAERRGQISWRRRSRSPSSSISSSSMDG